MKTSSQGIAPLIVVLAVAAAGIASYFALPGIFHGDTRRAKQSREASANVTDATKKVDTAVEHQASVAAASVQKIGEAAVEIPWSLQRDFILKEVGVAQALLPKPDSQALLDAERRKNAVMLGNLEESRRLYDQIAGKTQELEKERAQAVKERDVATAQRDLIDRKLEEVAAERSAAQRQTFMALVAVGLFAALWVYAKLFRVSPATLGQIAADVRNGDTAINAMNVHLAPWLHPKVRKAAQLATQPTDK